MSHPGSSMLPSPAMYSPAPQGLCIPSGDATSSQEHGPQHADLSARAVQSTPAKDGDTEEQPAAAEAKDSKCTKADTCTPETPLVTPVLPQEAETSTPMHAHHACTYGTPRGVPAGSATMHPMHMQGQPISLPMPVHCHPGGMLPPALFGMHAPGHTPGDMHATHGMMPMQGIPEGMNPMSTTMSPACMPAVFPGHMHSMHGMMPGISEASGMSPFAMYTPSAGSDATMQTHMSDGT